MADIKTKTERSANMSRIKGRDTKPEIQVRRYLSDHGIRYRCNVKSLPGTPDVAIKKYRMVIKVDGCFWHSHQGCKDFRIPKSNVEFWTEKLNTTVERDRKNFETLKKMGYKVFLIWECEIKAQDFTEVDKAISHVRSFHG